MFSYYVLLHGITPSFPYESLYETSFWAKEKLCKLKVPSEVYIDAYMQDCITCIFIAYVQEIPQS